MKLPVILASLMLLAGCVSAGVKVDEADLTKFEKGKTTYAQIVQTLGPPTSNSLLPDGRRLLAYTWVQARARPQNFIPLIGPLVGGADSRSTMVMIWIGADGTLASYSASQSQMGTGRNLEAGPDPGRVPDQPRTAGPGAR